jgi:hypothetical protein
MTKEETPEQLGARLFKEGKGLSHFWNDAPDTSKETLNRMLVGYQSEQEKCNGEPLGFMHAGQVLEMQQGRLPCGYVYPKRAPGASVALYRTPPQRKPLTDEEIWACLPKDPDEMAFARAIERAHGIKGEA